MGDVGTYLGFPPLRSRYLPCSTSSRWHLLVISPPPRVERVVLVDAGTVGSRASPQLSSSVMWLLSLLPVVLLMVVVVAKDVGGRRERKD